MKLIEIKKSTSQKLYLVFEFETEEMTRYIQIVKYKNSFSFSYNNTLFGRFIIYYKNELKKKNIFNHRMALKDFKSYLNFLKKYKNNKIFKRNYYFSEHTQKEKNLNYEIQFIKKLIHYLNHKKDFIQSYEKYYKKSYLV